MYRKWHKLVCAHCGHVEKQSEISAFMGRFFSPDMCSCCGEHGEWNMVVEKQRLTPPNRTINPITWLRVSSWEVVDSFTITAR